MEEEVGEIYISGGEPLLSDFVYDLIKTGKKHDILMTLGTNGMAIDEEKVKKLKEAWLDKIFVSLDHYQEEKHNFLRDGKVFDKAVKAIEYLKKYGIYIRIDSIIWKENYKDLDNFVNFYKERGVDEIAFAWVVKVGRAMENLNILPPKSEYFKIGDNSKELKEKYNNTLKISYHRFGHFDKSCKDCLGGRKIFYISPSGRLSPCFWITTLLPEFFTEKNIFETNFSELLRDKSIEKFINAEKERYEKFGPGCPAICVIENGKFHSKDPLFY